MGVAAFWAGAAHPRRQKRREMPPPGASAPTFAATVEPARARPHAKHPRQDACRGMCCFMHRFLISSPDLRINASFSPFTPSCVHRFLISSPNLGIDASFSTIIPSFVHRFLISSPNLGIDVSFSPETSFCVHRFLISSPDLRIDASFSTITPSFVHRFMISGPDLRIDAAQSSWRWRTARLQNERCGRRRGLDATKAA